jgi:hypothetical protein
MNAQRRSALALVTTVAASAALAASGPAYASGGSDDHGRHGGGSSRVVKASHSCATGVIKLKAKHDDGRIEVEAEVDTNHKGQTWTVRLRDNGVTVFSGKRTTHAPSGSFSLEKRIANRAGKDTITVRATRGSKVCSTRVTL